MSKSDRSKAACVFVTDSAETVQEKVRKAFTDSLGTIVYDPSNRHGVSNLVSLQNVQTLFCSYYFFEGLFVKI